jgi:hypothetical protein
VKQQLPKRFGGHACRPLLILLDESKSTPRGCSRRGVPAKATTHAVRNFMLALGLITFDTGDTRD